MTKWFRRRHGEKPVEPPVSADGILAPGFLAVIKTDAEAGDPEAMANLGAHFVQQGDFAQAISWTERAWRADNLVAGFNLGMLYLRGGDTNRADLVWTEAAGRGDVDAMLGLARLALGRDDRSTADRWRDLILGQRQPYPITAVGVAYRDHGDVDTAMRIFDTAIAMGDAYAMEYAARLHERNGDVDTATELRGRAAHSKRFGWGLVETVNGDAAP